MPALVPLSKTLNNDEVGILAQAKNAPFLNRRKQKIVLFFALAIAVSGGIANAIELLSPASSMDGKSWGVSAYGRHEKTEPNIKIGATDLEFDAKNDVGGLMLTVRPGDYLHYRFLYGVVSNYELQVDSGGFVNRHESHSDGYQYGFGARWNAMPQTSVSVGIALDLTYLHKKVDFDRLSSNGVVSPLDERLKQDEFQGAVNFSKRWKQLEPYGGLKLNYVQTEIFDRATLTRSHGNSDDWSPFVGLKWEFFPKESLIVEGSFADEESFSAGVNIQF